MQVDVSLTKQLYPQEVSIPQFHIWRYCVFRVSLLVFYPLLPSKPQCMCLVHISAASSVEKHFDGKHCSHQQDVALSAGYLLHLLFDPEEQGTIQVLHVTELLPDYTLSHPSSNWPMQAAHMGPGESRPQRFEVSLSSSRHIVTLPLNRRYTTEQVGLT
jgi:hypothetical protein